MKLPEIAELLGEFRSVEFSDGVRVTLPRGTFQSRAQGNASRIGDREPRFMLGKAYELGEAFLKKRFLFAISLSIFSASHGNRGSR